jgi:transcription initiation factor IIE alpha subunit
VTSSSDGVAEYGRPYQLPLAKYRKRRKSTGDEFTEKMSDELEAIERARRTDAGLYCKNCRRRIGWKKIDTSYSYHNGDFIRSWSCPDCGAQLKEDNLEELPTSTPPAP